MKIILFVALILFIGYAYFSSQNSESLGTSQAPRENQIVSGSDSVLANAYKNHTSNIQVTGEGTITRLLSDDNIGSRHQRFIIEVGSGQTLLVAHNIDIAPRIGSLSTGDSIQFCGEYEWNEKGGVIHWTHRTASGSHVPGWLKHNGTVYQ